MTGPGVELDVVAATRIAEQLARATTPLAAAAQAASEAPQAGPATAAVVAYLDAAVRAAGGLAQATDDLSGSLREAIAETQRQDQHGAERIGRPPAPPR